MSDQNDINAEYEKVFGTTSRETLFSADDENYASLRQEILDAKREFNVKKVLPFDGIKLYPYEEYLRMSNVLDAEKHGYRIFYIRKYDGQELVCYAAGYFNAKDSRFVVLKGSFFHQTDYYKSLVCGLNPLVGSSLTSAFENTKGTLKQTKDWTFTSASLAASLILGKKTTFREWKDNRGKSLAAYYAKYKDEFIDEKEDKAFPYIPSVSIKTSTSKITDDAGTLLANTVQSLLQPRKITHVFNIEITGKCRVVGYYDDEDNRFVVKKGSRFRDSVDTDFDVKPLGESRRRFIEAACMKSGPYLEVIKDTKCKSATAAASYIMGYEASYSLWKDNNGKYLKDIYPERFILDGNEVPLYNNQGKPLGQAPQLPNTFYIKRYTNKERACDASGFYDITTGQFVLRAGSILSIGAAISYAYSSQGVNRMNFLSKYCFKSAKGLVLRKDYAFDTPSAAASYVLGRSANGWQEWKNKDGLSIDSVVRQRND